MLMSVKCPLGILKLHHWKELCQPARFSLTSNCSWEIKQPIHSLQVSWGGTPRYTNWPGLWCTLPTHTSSDSLDSRAATGEWQKELLGFVVMSRLSQGGRQGAAEVGDATPISIQCAGCTHRIAQHISQHKHANGSRNVCSHGTPLADAQWW